MELSAGRLAIKLPGDLDSLPVHTAAPGFGLCPQSLQIRDAAVAQTLPREDPDLDFRLIETTAVGRRVVDREPLPDFRRHFRTENVLQCLAAMDVKVVATGRPLPLAPASGHRRMPAPTGSA